MKRQAATRILVAPLDWGLGHATRCIPIIAELRRHNRSVWLAASGQALWVLREAFPDLPFAELTSYRIRYSRTLPLLLHLFLQLPRIGWAVWKEHRQTKHLVARHQIDLIISDNRYGVRVRGVPAIFITHQCNIRMPAGLRALEPLVKRVNHYFLKRFDTCWVPDWPDGQLSGALSQPPLPGSRFIGPLSRMKKLALPELFAYDVVALISGPEPQRTLFEERLLAQLQALPVRYHVVRGLPGAHAATRPHTSNHLPAHALADLLLQAEVIVCRSGYSTVMDLAALGKKALFVPTPGQTEQEYLATHLAEKGLAVWQHQNRLDLKAGIAAAKKSRGFAGSTSPSNLLPKTIDALLNHA
jgi:uncharacterized protein (TIGR00661 family)